MDRYDFTAILKSQGHGDSAAQPKTAQTSIYRHFYFPSLLQNTHRISLVSQQSVLQKLVPICNKNTGVNILSCRVSLDERPERPCANVTLQNNFTPPMQSSLPPTNHKNDGEWKQRNKTENDARIFDGCLLSVLAQFKAIIKSNFKKTK